MDDLTKTWKMDCGDSSCKYTDDKSGMRTNGGCRCHEKFYFRNFAYALYLENKQLKELLKNEEKAV